MSKNWRGSELPKRSTRRGEPQTPEPRQIPDGQTPAAPRAPEPKRKRASKHSNALVSTNKRAKVTRARCGEQEVVDGQEQGQEVVARRQEHSESDPSDTEDVPVDNKYPIRRILAQKSSSTWRKEYLVEYFPTWESEAALKAQRKALKIWESNKRNGFTFDFQDRFVTKKIVLKATNPTSDDDPQLARQMLDTVMYQVRKFLSQPGLHDKLFKTGEWVYADEEAEEQAIELAEEVGEPTPNAAELMQATFDLVRTGITRGYTIDQMLHENKKHVQYHNIHVSYVGQLDDTIGQPASRDDRNFGTVLSYLRPMYELAQQDLDSATWEMPHLCSSLASLAEVVDEVIKQSPYLLRKKFVWPLFFVRFFVKADNIQKLLNPEPNPRKPGAETQKYEISQDWHEQTRNWFLQAYSEKVFGRWNPRALEYIERTYIQCRDGVMQRVEDAKKLKAGEEVSEDEQYGGETDEADERGSDIAASDEEDEEGDELYEA